MGIICLRNHIIPTPKNLPSMLALAFLLLSKVRFAMVPIASGVGVEDASANSRDSASYTRFLKPLKPPFFSGFSAPSLSLSLDLSLMFWAPPARPFSTQKPIVGV